MLIDEQNPIRKHKILISHLFLSYLRDNQAALIPVNHGESNSGTREFTNNGHSTKVFIHTLSKNL